MIGRLRGILAYRADDHVLIDVGGVGYTVYISDRTMVLLPRVGEALSLYTDLLVREDLLQLFGFSSLVEREWHRHLMSVQGIGAKASMSILGALGADGVGQAVALEDWSAIAQAKGVGPKTAQKVILDLKGKAAAVMSIVEPSAAPVVQQDRAEDEVIIEPAFPPATVDPVPSAGNSARADAISALQNLGYFPSDAARAVAQVLIDTPGADTSQLIRLALRSLAPKGE